jgi:hypothetical protein
MQHLPAEIWGKILSSVLGYNKKRLPKPFLFGELDSYWKKKVVFQLILVD